MDDFDRRLLNRLQHGLPLVRDPWAALGKELDCSPDRLRQRLQELLDDGTLTRFGPMFDIEQLGGAFTLAAMTVPEERFDAVTEQLNQIAAVAHNYRREHVYNMWFVLACPTPEGIAQSIAEIEALTGLSVLNLPKEKTYHVGLHFPL